MTPSPRPCKARSNELKRWLRREVVGDMRPILEAQGIQFPDIGGVMSDEEHRSSFVSIVAAG
jgi:hypothetical protein